MGTGSGVWALLAVAAGARVTATERVGVPLDGLAEAAASLGAEVERRTGDLFAPVRGRAYDTVCFNPPFHDGAPAPGEEAWVGGGVVRRFLVGLADHLRAGGRGLLVLPRSEQARYAAHLDGRPGPPPADGAPWDPDLLHPRRWVDHLRALLTLWAARAAGVTRLVDLVTVRPLASGDVGGRADVLVVPWVQTVPAEADGVALAAVEGQVASIKTGGARAELARLALYAGLADLLPTARAAALTFRRVIKTDLIVTNPGPVHVPIERFGPVPVADFLNFPQLVPPARSGYVFTTFRGRLRVVALWDDATWPAGPPGELDGLLARIEAEVAAA